MNNLIRFLKWRKQNDWVKVVIIFCILALVLSLSLVQKGINIYNEANESIELVLTSLGDRQKSKVDALRNDKNILSASYQLESSVQVGDINWQATLKCIEVSKEYAQYAYNIEYSSATRIFYVNKAGIDFINNEYKKYYYTNVKVSDISLEYNLGEEKGKCRFILCDNLQQSDPLLITVSNSDRLKKSDSNIRVYIKNKGFGQSNLKCINSYGFNVIDRNILDIELLKEENKLNVFKYQAIIFALCIVFIFSLVKFSKK